MTKALFETDVTVLCVQSDDKQGRVSRSVGHVSTGWIMLQSLHCMHCMQLCVTFLPSSHYCHAVTLDIEQHTLS